MRQLIAIACVLAAGCSTVPGPDAFHEAVAAGDIWTAEKIAAALFETGSDASLHASTLAQANDTRKRNGIVSYRFWLSRKNPKLEGDAWIEIRVDTGAKPPAILDVDGLILQK